MHKSIYTFLLLYTILVYTNSLNAINEYKQSSTFPAISIKLDSSNPIKIEPGPIELKLPNLKNVGSELGSGIGDLFSTGAASFANTTNSKKYDRDMSRGLSGMAKSMGNAIGNFNTEAEAKLFPELSTTFRGVVGSAVNPRNVFQFGGLIALSFVISTTGYYLTKLAWEVITHKILNPQPVILLPSTTYGHWGRIKLWWADYKTPEMIFDESIKERLKEIEEKTKIIRAYNKNRKNRRKKINYDNLLLHGEPGTGKTLFARTLADHTNMDFIATTAASLLQSGTAGIKYFNDIMAMARKSSYGVVFFIDEADALFIDRDMLNPDSDHYKILSHILAITGDGNNNFMLVAATNHAYIMDSAMGRRFQDRVLMPLPDEQTRKELIELYVQKILFNIQINSTMFVNNARLLLNKEIINSMIEKTIGLSHAEIKDMIEAMHKKSCASKDGIITLAHVTNAINQAIEKYTMLETDKEKKRARFKYSN